MINEQRMLDEFLQLVQIDSESRDEKEIAACLKQKLVELGLSVYEDDTAAITGHTAGNLIAEWKGNKAGVDPILFTCHMDTVAPGVSVKPVIREGVVYSDGTTVLGADDKAGIAALLEAIRVMNENQIPHGDVQLIFTVGEEIGLVGSKAMDASALKAKFGYALDGGGAVGSQYIAAPTQAKLFINIHGKTAHAGVEPEKGISAITIASKAIANMPLGRIDEETTANIGCIEGGTSTNVVCEHVYMEAEARSLVKEKMEAQVNTMKTAFEAAANEMGGRADVEVKIMYSEFKFDENAELVQVAARATEKIGRKPSVHHTGGGSDGNIFNGHGVPTTILGVGYEEIHTKNERMPIAELNKLAELTIAIIEEVANK